MSVSVPTGAWTLFHADKFLPSSQGWRGSKLFEVECGVLGRVALVLKGFEHTQGRKSFLEKKFSGLPPHSALRIELQFMAIDAPQHEELQLYVDNSPAWSSPLAQLGTAGGRICGTMGRTDLALLASTAAV